MACGRLLSALKKNSFEEKVAVVSAEAEVGYNRVLLPGLVAGDCSELDLSLTEEWSDWPQLTLLTETNAEFLDLQSRLVRTDAHGEISFKRLVFATGSSVVRPDLQGLPDSRVLPLRNIADAQSIKHSLVEASTVAVLGGGLLGLEGAEAIARMGHTVHVVHRGSHLMNRQLDADSGMRLAEALKGRGLHVHLGCSIERAKMGEGANSQIALTLSNGELVHVDHVVLATGVRPNVDLARASGIPCNFGIEVDRYMATGCREVYAIGECAEVVGEHHALVEAVNLQADTLAANLCGEDVQLESRVCGTTLKLADLPLFAIGETATPRPTDAWVDDATMSVYRRLFMKGEQLVGSVLYGDTRASRGIASRIGQSLSLEEQEHLLFGTVPG